MKPAPMALLSILLAATPCLAHEEVSCDGSCPSGNRLISFLDGDNTHCMCVEEAVMDPTVPNASYGDDDEDEDDD